MSVPVVCVLESRRGRPGRRTAGRACKCRSAPTVVAANAQPTAGCGADACHARVQRNMMCHGFAQRVLFTELGMVQVQNATRSAKGCGV
eukprot:1288208-Prymnesium_polylepis.1